MTSTILSRDAPNTLLDLSARIVAEHIPFELIERRYEHVPEPVQRRIIFWSFPRSEDDIMMYSSLSSETANNTPQISHNKQFTFYKGLNLFREGAVRDVLQIGFNLTGLVTAKSVPIISSQNGSRIRGNANSTSAAPAAPTASNFLSDLHNNSNESIYNQNPNNSASSNDVAGASSHGANTANKNFRVSVTFDRCKITSVSCSCEFHDIFWCEHVVALILYRIRNPETIDLRVPISETLLSLDRQQLQKLVQYIITEHYTDVLPTAQRLLDEMHQPASDINQIQGAPDPTAGASADDEHIWHLDEYQVNEKVQNYLNLVYVNSKDASKQITSLFEKIREMFKARDSNGTRLLKLITEQFLLYATRNEKSRPLWDQLVSLWVVVMLNPDLTATNRKRFARILINWSKVQKCPREDIERRTGIKRKTADLSDDEEADYFGIHPELDSIYFSFSPSNNYPAHMATHRPRAFQLSNNSIPVLKTPYNQHPLLSCLCQVPRTKKMKTHLTQHCNPSVNGLNQIDTPSTSSSHHNAPRIDQIPNQDENRPTEPRSVFHRALDFLDCSWSNPHLQLILNRDGTISTNVPQRSDLFDQAGYPLWTECLTKTAARIETLRAHGYRDQALRLTVASVRRLKVLQNQWSYAVSEHIGEIPCMFKGLADDFSEGWLGHPMDPINVMVDLLLSESVTRSVNGPPGITDIRDSYSGTCRCPYSYNTTLRKFTHRMMPTLPMISPYTSLKFDESTLMPIVNLAPRRQSGTTNQSQATKPFDHVPVPGCCRKESHLMLAFELALIALGQQRSLPTTATAHERAVRQESDLIAKLELVDTAEDLVLGDILSQQASLLVQGGPFHTTCCSSLADPAPIHTFCRYLFESLLPHCPVLAYKVGVHALKMPLLLEDTLENVGAARTSPRGVNYNHLQSEQLALAQAMVTKSRDDINSPTSGSFLRKVSRAAIRNIRNPASLLKLAKHAHKESRPHITMCHALLLKASYDFGLQVLKMTLSPHTSNGKTRREAVIFIIDCATDLGFETMCQLMKDSREYFSPTEALSLVVTSDSDHVNLRTKATSKMKDRGREEELHSRYRDLVLDCTVRDPTNCALDALKFCESHHESLRKGLKIVMEAGTTGAMDSTQLIKVAEWISKIHGRGWFEKAFQIAMVAVESLSIPSNSDNTASKKDIFSACEYAQKVPGGFGLLIPRLIENIECAIVLSDIYHRFHPNTIAPPRYRYLPMGGCKPVTGFTTYNDDLRCWDLLLKRTLERFIDTTRTRLQNISPRHYAEFIEFLVKAEETFDKADNGPQQFKDMISEIMKSYRTKKKLMERLKSRFDPPINKAYA